MAPKLSFPFNGSEKAYFIIIILLFDIEIVESRKRKNVFAVRRAKSIPVVKKVISKIPRGRRHVHCATEHLPKYQFISNLDKTVVT